MSSPTERTLAYLKKGAYIAQVVERWNPYARIRVDLFGVIDVIAMHPLVGIIGIQTTSGSNAAARVTKALNEPRLLQWLICGGHFSVWSWSKRKIGKRSRWTVRRCPITAAMIEGEWTMQVGEWGEAEV